MDDLAELTAAVTGFASAENMTVVPAVPEHDCGPEVCLGPDELDLPEFLTLAARLGGGVIYQRSVQFDPDSDPDQPDDPPARLTARKGQPCQISVAFAANGVVHFWEDCAAWYREWEELAAVGSYEPGEGQDTRPSEADRTRLVGELVDAVLADQQFRAAATHGKRQRIARQSVPKDAEQWGAGWEVAREACERAQEMTEAIYGQLEDRLDELAAGLLATPAWQQASSPPARRQAAGRFLIALADGFAPPSSVREELYARARDLAKAAKTSGSGLF